MENLSVKTLKRSFADIKRVADGKGDCSDWIRDNFHTIDLRYKSARSNKKAFKNGKLQDVMRKHPKIGKVDFDYIIKVINGENIVCSLDQITSIPDILSADAIITLASAIKPGGDAALVPDLVRMLINISETDMTDIIPDIWRPEKTFLQFEPEYADFDSTTKQNYREKLVEYAKKNGLSEISACEKLQKKAKREKSSLGEILFVIDKKYPILWGIIAFALFAAMTAFSAYVCGLVTLLLVFPIGAAAIYTSDFIAALIVKPYKAPRMKTGSVPDGSKTLIAVAALMNGSDSDDRLYKSLSRFAFMHPDKNIFFCLLADLPDSVNQYNVADSAAIEKARTAIDALNDKFDNRFCLFMREREYNASESTYGGYERKRGAVCKLIEHIKEGSGSDSYYGGDFISDIKYVITLDSDTNLSLGSVNELLAVAAHPLNRAKVKNGRVVSGYGIIQPAMRTELKSAYATGFARMESGDAGADRYASASFKRSQDLFGVGSFCGKGLIDVDAFYKCVCGKLPDGLILSHDVIEGGIMRTMCVSDISLTDSMPKNPVSFFRRQHRWMRGDFQNLFFVFTSYSKLLPHITRVRLTLSALRHAVPFFAVSAVALTFYNGFAGMAAFSLAYSYLFIPNTLYSLRYFVSGAPFAVFRYFSKTLSVLLQIGVRTFFELSSSCRQAFLVFHAYLLAGIRLVTRKKTLEWTTAAQTEKLASGLGKYVLDGAFSLAFGLLLLALSPAPFTRLAGVLYFIYPLASAVMSQPIYGGEEHTPSLTAKQKDILKAHARDMWRFYSDNVSETTNFLPPDNIQLSPVSATAMRTSPTNIGFYLVSAMAACDLGFIEESELYERLSSTLKTIYGLEKYKGNLYNWYDLQRCEVIGDRFVSSVDSGNFTVMLSALRSGLLERDPSPARNELIKLCGKLLANTDLTAFYDKKRELFYIGVRDGGDTDGIGHYDMLMSEMRMTSYYAAATGAAPKIHWQRLNRTVTAKNGYLGMLSWSGTMFEYLMPQLFMPLYRDSFIYESIAFAVNLQRSSRRIWGVSESAFYSFNSDMHYQYKANGLQALALRRCGRDENVVSPYSCYLASTVCPGAVLKNLDKLAKKGMYGKYGMYEALDLNNGDGIAVKCYMAHHVGMSMIACLNAVCGNVFIRRFTNDGRIDAASELLTESVPQSPHIYNGIAVSPYPKRAIRRDELSAKREGEPDVCSPKISLINRGDITLTVSDIGHIGLNCGEKLLAHTEFESRNPRFTLSVTFLRGGKSFGCAPIFGGDLRYTFERGRNYACHIAAGSDFSGRVKYGISKSGDCFVIETRAEAIKKYDVMLSFEPVLCGRQEYLSHISFKRLFVESEYDAQRNILYFHRRSVENGKHIFTVAVAPRDKKQRVKFASNADGIPALSPDITAVLPEVALDCKTGACVDPYCIFKICGADGGHAAFLIACGETKDECAKSLRAARCDLRLCDSKEDQTAERMLAPLLYGNSKGAVDDFCHACIEDLWALGISGDLPFISVFVKKPAYERVAALTEAFLYMSRAGIRSDLLFIVEDGDLYGRPAERALREAITNAGGNGYLGCKGGIFILRAGNIKPNVLTGIKLRSRAVYELENSLLFPEAVLRGFENGIICKPQARILPLPDDALQSAYGYFENDTFTVDKSKSPKAPYTFVLTGRRFSTVLTQSSLGLTFFDNAHERRIASFYGDVATNDDGERILLETGGVKYDVCACAYKVTYGMGKAVYLGMAGGTDYSLTVFVCEKFPVKIMRLQCDDKSARACFEVKPVMGDGISPVCGIEKKAFERGENGIVLMHDPFSRTFSEGYGFIGAVNGKADADVCGVYADGNDIIFFIGACTTQSGALETAARINGDFYNKQLALAEKFAQSLVPSMSFSTDGKEQDVLLNRFVPYQVAACRFFARGSFYQSGGAYGFRDQLQDCLAMVYALPQTVRTHIIRCCAHQYTDGSVMHWWHTKHYSGVNRGIKTKCSDDLLYLPLAVCEYIGRTGDISVLDVEVSYIESSELGRTERERYELPRRSELKESVYRHCLRVFDRAAQIGEHGLILMGSCDWNDAFSLVGEKGRGESVFSTMLYVFAAERFLPLIRMRGDKDTALRLEQVCKGFRANIESKTFFKDRYARAFFDDGTPLGVMNDECGIDIISQAWAALIKADTDNVRKALNTAFYKLYDEKNALFKLFDPPFTDGGSRVGYVRGYAAGLRENGGQYTHGALWGALGYLAADMTDKALAVFSCANPASRSRTKESADKYRIEPYAIAADIYGGDNSGRGGWSWYTGAASWYYKTAVEGFMGIDLTLGGKRINVRPKIGFKAEIGLKTGRLTVVADNSVTRPTLDGRFVELPLDIPDGDHILNVPTE